MISNSLNRQMYSSENGEIIMFAGKGGVGKTTCAAATALFYSKHDKRTLLISTDPTPSLRHIFETGSCQELMQVTEKLFLEELGVNKVIQMWDKKFGREVYEVFSSFVDIEYDEFVSFISSVLPGLREEFMVDYIRDMYERSEYDIIIWDTAPLGQTLELLGTPGMIRKHLRQAPKIYTKFKFGVNIKKSILDIIHDWEILSTKDVEFLKTTVRFNVVTIPEALAFEQLEEIFNEFNSYELKVDKLIINNVIKDTSSQFLASKAELQQQYINLLMNKFCDFKIIQVPLFAQEIKGIKGLNIFQAELFKTT